MHRAVQKNHRLVSAVIFFSLFFAQPAFAVTHYVDLSLEQLLQIQVHSVSKSEQPLGDAPAAVYAITSADIERLGVTNIPDALRLVPGVEVARADSNSWAISIRGFNSVLANKLLVLLDGRTIYNPVFGGVLWEAHNLMLENIERIEVIRGAGGTLWGANAVNGVINITTKHSRDTQDTLVTALHGNEEKGTVSARHGGVFGETGTYRIYAKGIKQDSAVKAQSSPGAPRQDNYDAWDGVRAGFRMDWSDTFTLHGDAYRTNADQLRQYYSYVTPRALTLEQNIVYEGANVLGQWNTENANGSKLAVQAYVHWAKRDEPYNFVDDRTTFDLEAQYNFAPSPRHEIITGAGFRLHSYDKKGNENVSFEPARSSDKIYNAFVQDKITLVPESLYLTIGTKIEYSDHSDWEHQPSVSLQWHLEQQTLWTSYGRAARTATSIEKNLTSTIGAAQNVRVAFVPNENFQSELLSAFEVGYRNQITPRVSLDVASFYNEYEQLTTFTVQTPVIINNNIDPLHMLVPVIFANEMEGHTSGVELAVGWGVNEQLHISASYSYLDMELRAINPVHESAEKLSPAQQMAARFFWDSMANWSVGASAKYTDELPTSNTDDYVRVDVNLGFKLSQALKFNLVGQNLLDSTHREFGNVTDINVAEIERSIFGKVTWQF